MKPIFVKTFVSIASLSIAVSVALLALSAPGAAMQALAAKSEVQRPDTTSTSTTTDYFVFLPIVMRSRTVSAPIITSFTANPATIAPGGTSTLSWSVAGATSLSISPGVGTVTGLSVNVKPGATTEYTLLASNAAGSASAKITVKVTPGGGGDTGNFWLPYIGGNSILTTYGTSIAVDSGGGIHVGYALYSGLDNGQRPAYYAYCAANCASIANWSLTRLSNKVSDVRLALDPLTGHPRMMIYTWDLDTDAHDYQYAVCDSGCASSANWTITVLTTNYEIPTGRSYNNNRYFAFDPQGGPAFVYTDNAGEHTGTFYAHCSSGCTNAGNWSEIQLSSQEIGRPSLTFTPDGQPRLAASYFVSDDPVYNQATWKLVYAGCYSNCNNVPQSQWGSTFVVPVIGNASFSLRVDANGRPRIAFYPTSVDLSLMQPGQLYYLWCDSATCLDLNDWRHVSVGTPIASGDGVDLILDPANRPRMAFQMGDVGLGYAACDANCGVTSSWHARTLESTASIMNLYPPGLPQHESCPILTWLNGVRPSLALDLAGNPRVGYDAELWWGGTSPYVHCNIAVPVARFGLFNK